MVAVAGRVCVDRYEATLVDVGSGAPMSPFYPPAREASAALFETWTRAREAEPDGTLARLVPVPPPWPADVLPGPLLPRATSVAGSIPNGYVNGVLASQACVSAGKRLCTDAEWRTACRGADLTQFPYGSTYRQGACNVFREEHPAHLLHGSAAHNHHDPRLNLMMFEGQPLLRATGATQTCASRWGDDAIYDMVGNLDEWIEDPDGTFLGGFFSRATRAGCESRIGGHPIDYFDYSTGVRCCKNPE
jgi:formylglycine-generating enzyme